jgi:hypothetical protein
MGDENLEIIEVTLTCGTLDIARSRARGGGAQKAEDSQ